MLKASQFVTQTESLINGGGNWSLKKRIKFDSESFAENVTGLTEGTYMLRAAFDSVTAPATVGLTFNEDASSSYSYTTIWPRTDQSGAASNASTVGYVPVYPPGWASGKFTTEMVITAIGTNVTTSATPVLSTTYPGSGGTSLCGWNGGPLESIQVTSFGNSHTGHIELYEWQAVGQATEYHTYELVEEFTLDDSVLDQTIAWSSDDIRIVSDCSVTLYGRLNGDSGSSSYVNVTHYGGTSHGNNAVNSDRFILANQRSFSEMTSSFAVTGRPRTLLKLAAQHTNAGDWCLTYSGTWNNTTDKVTSIRLFSDDAGTGYVKVYRLAKTALLDTAINKVETEQSLLTTKKWDGKLAMALDTKDVFVYDEGTDSWLGKLGAKQQANVYGWKLLAKGDTITTAGITVSISGTQVLMRAKCASDTAVMPNVRVRANGSTGTYRSNFLYSSTSGAATASVSTLTTGFGFLGPDWSTQHRGAYELSIVGTSDGILAAASAATRSNVSTPNAVVGSMLLEGETSLDSVTLYHTTTDASVDYEIYEWTSISVPAANGVLPTVEASSGFVASSNTYVLADTSSAGFTITLPQAPSLGDELVVLDVSDSFGINVCTIDPAALLLDGTGSTQGLGTGETRLKYVGSNVGWKTIA